MSRYRCLCRRCVWLMVATWIGSAGCESPPPQSGPASNVGPARRAELAPKPRPTAGSDVPHPPQQVPTRPLPPAETQPAAAADISDQVPDPRDIGTTMEQERDAEIEAIDRRTMVPEDKDRERREVQAEVDSVASFFDAWIAAARLARAVGRSPSEAWGPSGWLLE